MKRWGLGTYHGLRRKHIGTYLNEFVFRYNRRFYRHVSFETMLGLERDVPVEAPIVSEDKLVEIGADVLAAQPMIGAEPPALHQHSLSDRALATQCPLALGADRQRTAPLYYILTNLGQRDEPS